MQRKVSLEPHNSIMSGGRLAPSGLAGTLPAGAAAARWGLLWTKSAALERWGLDILWGQCDGRHTLPHLAPGKPANVRDVRFQ